MSDKTREAEITALAEVIRSLDELKPAEVERILDYVAARHGVRLQQRTSGHLRVFPPFDTVQPWTKGPPPLELAPEGVTCDKAAST